LAAKAVLTVAATTAALCLSACGSLAPATAAPAPRQASPGVRAGRSSQVSHASPASRIGRGTSSPRLRLLTEPAAGPGPVYRLIRGARRSVDLTMYELQDKTAEADLAAAAQRKVTVRVLLDRQYEQAANQSAYRYLTAHGVHVRWAPAGVLFHQKTLTVDDKTSVIMTGNLQSRYYAGTRDFAVIDTSRADVAAIVTTFNADFAGRQITPPDGTDLVWSPTNAQSAVLAVISRARHTLAVEDEEMADASVTGALVAAARRGVNVQIIMTADARWDAAFTRLARAGAHIRLYPDTSQALYIHAKVIVADAGRTGQRVLIGSQNFSVASLDYNRELGIDTTSPSIIRAVSATLARDYAGGTPYRPGKQKRGAWCRATASVYNARYDENNVYVHSNQPRKIATARADGYAHSYRTNGSGYALIYLNGPPPGVTITVRVGGAACTARD